MTRISHNMPDNDLLSQVKNINLMDDEFSFNRGGKTGQTIVLEQYNNCVKEGSKEMSPGGVQKRVINGEVVEVFVPNQVEIFINHVEMLKRALVHDTEHESDIAKKLNWFEEQRRRYILQYKKKRHDLLKYFNSLSSVKNPEGYSETDLYRDKYSRLKQHIERVYNEKMLELYQEQLFPFLTLLISRRSYFTGD